MAVVRASGNDAARSSRTSHRSSDENPINRPCARNERRGAEVIRKKSRRRRGRKEIQRTTNCQQSGFARSSHGRPVARSRIKFENLMNSNGIDKVLPNESLGKFSRANGRSCLWEIQQKSSRLPVISVSINILEQFKRDELRKNVR